MMTAKLKRALLQTDMTRQCLLTQNEKRKNGKSCDRLLWGWTALFQSCRLGDGQPFDVRFGRPRPPAGESSCCRGSASRSRCPIDSPSWPAAIWTRCSSRAPGRSLCAAGPEDRDNVQPVGFVFSDAVLVLVTGSTRWAFPVSGWCGPRCARWCRGRWVPASPSSTRRCSQGT